MPLWCEMMWCHLTARSENTFVAPWHPRLWCACDLGCFVLSVRLEKAKVDFAIFFLLLGGKQVTRANLERSICTGSCYTVVWLWVGWHVNFQATSKISSGSRKFHVHVMSWDAVCFVLAWFLVVLSQIMQKKNASMTAGIYWIKHLFKSVLRLYPALVISCLSQVVEGVCFLCVGHEDQLRHLAECHVRAGACVRACRSAPSGSREALHQATSPTPYTSGSQVCISQAVSSLLHFSLFHELGSWLDVFIYLFI